MKESLGQNTAVRFTVKTIAWFFMLIVLVPIMLFLVILTFGIFGDMLPFGSLLFPVLFVGAAIVVIKFIKKISSK